MVAELKEQNVKILLAEAKSLRKLAVCASMVAAFATIMSIVFVPMLYNYTQYVQSSLQEEINFCKHRTQGLYGEFEKVYHLFLSVSFLRFYIFQFDKRRGKRNSHFIIPSAGILHTASFAANTEFRRVNRQGGYGASALANGYNAVGVNLEPEIKEDLAPAYAPAKEKPVKATSSYDGTVGEESDSVKEETHFNAQCSCGVGLAGPPGLPGIDGTNGN